MTKKDKKKEWVGRPLKIAAGMVVLLAVYVVQLPTMINPVNINFPALGDAPEGNNKLAPMRRFYRQLEGAESLHFDGDLMYTGLVDGRIVVIDVSQVERPLSHSLSRSANKLQTD